MQPQMQPGIPPPIPQEPRGSGWKVAVALVIVVVIVVAVIVVALVAGWFGGSSKPTVSFSPIVTGGSGQNRTAVWTVTSVSQQNSFSSYRFVMDKDSTPIGSPQSLAGNTMLSMGSNVYLIVADADANGRLSTSDAFLVYGMSAGHSWTLRLLWSDGSFVQSATWGGTSPITIGISIQSTGSNWTMIIASVTQGVAYADVMMLIMDANGVNVPPMVGVSLADLTPANWGTYHVTFQNMGTGTDLTVGSSILVYKPVYLVGYRYTLVVGSTIAATGTFD